MVTTMKVPPTSSDARTMPAMPCKSAGAATPSAIAAAPARHSARWLLAGRNAATTVDAAAVTMSSLRRLEGASDPDDMLAVVALTCPACGTDGTVVLGYGPNGTAEDGDVLKALRDERNVADVSGNSAPGEAAGDDSSTGR